MPALAGPPPPTVQRDVSAGSRRWGGSSMFQPKGWEGDGACPGPRHQPPDILTEPPCAAAPCLSTPRPGILPRPCQRGSRYGERRWQRARPLRAARAGAHAPSPLKNATFRRQHPFCKPQPKQPGVNHGRDGAGLAPWAMVPLPQPLKAMELLCTCFSDPRFPRAHELFTAHTPQPDCHLQALQAAP